MLKNLSETVVNLRKRPLGRKGPMIYVKNQTDFWDAWKAFDENISVNTKPALQDGEIWEEYYNKLFNDNSTDEKTVPNKVKYGSIEPSTIDKFLNNVLSNNELERTLKSSKMARPKVKIEFPTK